MLKIIFFSGVLISGALAVDHFYSSGTIRTESIVRARELVQTFQETPSSLPQVLGASVKNVVDDSQKNVVKFFLEKAGREIVGVLETLPPEQQKEIKKVYCSE